MRIRLGIILQNLYSFNDYHRDARPRLVLVSVPRSMDFYPRSYHLLSNVDSFSDADITKIITLGLGLNPSFSIAKTTGTAVSAITACPANALYNYTITWGLQDYQYQWHVTGTKEYGGWDPLMRDCDADQIAHKDGGTFPFVSNTLGVEFGGVMLIPE